MISELEPIWKQVEETYAAVRKTFEAVPDDRLQWSVQPDTWTPSLLIQHIANANVVYSQVMTRIELTRPPRQPDMARPALEALLDKSEHYVHDIFEQIQETEAHQKLEDNWTPLGPPVEGPLDAIWFAIQIVRHSAYHLGQLNYLAELGGFAGDFE